MNSTPTRKGPRHATWSASRLSGFFPYTRPVRAERPGAGRDSRHDRATGDNIVLIGPMGAGKSSVARELARLTARRWTDTDKQVVQQSRANDHRALRAGGRAVLPPTGNRGAPGADRTSVRLIVATGGGIVTRPENFAIDCGRWDACAFLTASAEVLFERVSRNRQRPLLQTDDPRATLYETNPTPPTPLRRVRPFHRGHFLGRHARRDRPDRAGRCPAAFRGKRRPVFLP